MPSHSRSLSTASSDSFVDRAWSVSSILWGERETSKHQHMRQVQHSVMRATLCATWPATRRCWKQHLSTILPPVLLAYSQLKRAVRAPPTCRLPVGEGANRTLTCTPHAALLRKSGSQENLLGQRLVTACTWVP